MEVEKPQAQAAQDIAAKAAVAHQEPKRRLGLGKTGVLDWRPLVHGRRYFRMSYVYTPRGEEPQADSTVGGRSANRKSGKILGMSSEGKDGHDVNALSARLRILEDERAILETLHRYGHAMDYGPDTEFVSCFVVNGCWIVRMRRSRAGFTCRGHDEIAASLVSQMSVRVPALYAKHIVVDPRITLDGDNANVVSYFLRVEPRNDGPTRIVASGRYLDRMVRSHDGCWRFEERIAEIDDM
jgi:hypothetical protein